MDGDDHNRHRPLFYFPLRQGLSRSSGEAWTRAPGIIFGLATIAHSTCMVGIWRTYCISHGLLDYGNRRIGTESFAGSTNVHDGLDARIGQHLSPLLLDRKSKTKSAGGPHRCHLPGVFNHAHSNLGLLLAAGMCGIALVSRRNGTAALAIAVGYGLLPLAWLFMDNGFNYHYM